MHKLFVVTLTLACGFPASAADNKFDPEARVRAIAPYLDEETIALGHADVTRLNPEAIGKKLAAIGQVPAEDLGISQLLFTNWVEKFTKAGGKEIYFVASLADLQAARAPALGFAIVPLEEGADGKALASLLGMVFEVGAKLPGDKAVFGGTRKALERVSQIKPVERPEVAKAFAAAGDTAVQLLLVPTADNRRVIEEMVPKLPKEIGGGATRIVTQGMLWAALGVNVTPKISLKLVIQSKEAAAARALQVLLERIVEAFAAQKEVREELPDFAKLVAPLIPRLNDDQLTANVTEQQLAAVLKKAVSRVWEAAGRARSAKNLGQLGVAMHTYLDAKKTFPTPASYDNEGKPLLSWRVHLLPYLNHTQLYKEFHFDEPWDSDHNKKLIARIPPVYQSGNRKLTEAGKTLYLAPLGKDTMFPGKKGVKIADVTDGTANTIMLVEAIEARAVVWTRPDDLKIDPKKPLAGLADKNKSFLALFADASARTLMASIDPKTLWALFTRNGGEVVGPF